MALVMNSSAQSIDVNENALVVNQVQVCLQNRTLLTGISFSIDVGEVVSVIGPNGAGKSTLLRALAGDLVVDSGEIIINGVHRSDWPSRHLACCLAVLPQHSRLNFPFTVREVVGLGRLPHESGTVADNNYINQAMERMDVLQLANRRYTQLSGGEKQRVQLARVIAQLFPLDSSINKTLLLDEPCTGLDLKHQVLLTETIKEFAHQGLSVLLSAHDLNWTFALSDKVLCLKHGKRLAFGGLEDIVDNTFLQSLFDVKMTVQKGSESDRPRVFIE